MTDAHGNQIRHLDGVQTRPSQLNFSVCAEVDFSPSGVFIFQVYCSNVVVTLGKVLLKTSFKALSSNKIIFFISDSK